MPQFFTFHVTVKMFQTEKKVTQEIPAKWVSIELFLYFKLLRLYIKKKILQQRVCVGIELSFFEKRSDSLDLTDAGRTLSPGSTEPSVNM